MGQMQTSFPNSPFSYGIGGRVITGQTLFVGSTASAASDSNSGKTPRRAFATINAAMAKCDANQGDHIVVLPGHVETVAAAAGLSLGVAGVTLIGLGSGAARPKINFTTAVGADMNVDAASIRMENFLFTGGIDALTGPIDVNASDFQLIGCETRDVTGQATDFIVTDANADRLLIDGWVHRGAAAAGAAAALALIGCDNPTIRNFSVIGNFSVAPFECRTTAVVDLEIHSGYMWQKNAADVCIVDTVTGSTGRIGPDLQFMLTDNAANITEAVTGATFHLFDPIYVANLAGEKGMLINTTASTDA